MFCLLLVYSGNYKYEINIKHCQMIKLAVLTIQMPKPRYGVAQNNLLTFKYSTNLPKIILALNRSKETMY